MTATELSSALTDNSKVVAIISEICDRVVLAINTSGAYARISSGKSKVPPELVHATAVLCRHAVISSAPGSRLNDTLQGGARAAEYQAALDTLKQVSDGELELADYTIGVDPGDLIDESGDGPIIWGSDHRVEFGRLI